MRAMVKQDVTNQIMDGLYDVGARGIIVTPIWPAAFDRYILEGLCFLVIGARARLRGPLLPNIR